MNELHRIQRLLDSEIVWMKEAGASRWFALFEREKCLLALGDFPAEPLYTLSWRGACIKFDDTPPKWTLPRD